ncbi:MAG: hypothetical protein NZL85_09060, partial [Fimbriimonadales bacterium]|nr:hypothetical protein [Fimbriimonadales bacterium]
RLLQDALRFVAQLRSPTEQTACLERLAPLSPAYLISPQAAMEALQRDVRRLQRERRRAAAQRAARQTDTPEQEAPASAHGQDVRATMLSVQLPRAVIEAERTVLRAVLSPETAIPALEQLLQIEWSLPEHRALAQTLYQLPQPPYRYAERDLLNAIPDESLQNLLTGLLLQTEPPLSPTTVAECLTYLHRRKERARRLQILNELTHSDQPSNPEKWQEYWRLRAES